MENKYEQANADAVEWGKITRKKLALRVGALTLKDRRALQKAAWHKRRSSAYGLAQDGDKGAGHTPLLKSIGTNFKREFGQIYRINFRFARQGIFVEHGVGQRRVGRSPKPWLAPILDTALQELADLLIQRYADIIVGEIKISIPGVISQRVRVGIVNTP